MTFSLGNSCGGGCRVSLSDFLVGSLGRKVPLEFRIAFEFVYQVRRYMDDRTTISTSLYGVIQISKVENT